MEWVELGELVNIRKGTRLIETENEKYSVRMIMIEDLRNDENIKFTKPNDKSVLVNSEDIVIAWDGANAGIVGFDLKGALGSTLARLSLTAESVSPVYLGLFLQKMVKEIRDNCTGATIPHVNRNHLTKIQIPIISIDIQHQIVQVLDKAQKIIDQRKEQIDLLDNLIESVFYDMFGDPVKNINGFRKGTIRDMTKHTQYGSSKKAADTGEFPIIRMGNLTYRGNWDFKDLKYIDLDDKEKEKYLVKKGDLLFNRTNSRELVGKTGVYKEDVVMAYAGYLIKLEPNELGNTKYISCYLNSQHGKLTLLNMAKSIVGMANINAQELQDIKILIPPLSLQNEFAKKVELIEQQKGQMEESLRFMKDNYNSLMQKAFKGELF